MPNCLKRDYVTMFSVFIGFHHDVSLLHAFGLGCREGHLDGLEARADWHRLKKAYVSKPLADDSVGLFGRKIK